MTALSYRAAVDRLLSLADFERKSRAGEPPDFHLRRMDILLRRLGRPHLAVPTVHVAGSKGKGSTCAMIAAALGANGMRVGLYTSPHLHTFRERIRVGPALISEAAFAALVARLWPHVEAVEQRGDCGRVSVFELLTAMAFCHFRETNADIQVIEVGLGGRLDATNLVEPEVAVVTPVGLDHVSILGHTVGLIAAEKAGIIKPGAHVVTGRQVPDACRVIADAASRCGCVPRDAMRRVKVIAGPAPSLSRQSVALFGDLGRYRIELPLLGRHQVDNARVAVCAVEALAERGFPIRPEAVAEGLGRVEWPARFQILSRAGPSIVVDGAHNVDSASMLVDTINECFPHRRAVILVAGGTKGHDFRAAARVLATLDPVVIATRTRHPKAVAPEHIADAFRCDNGRVAAVARDSAAAASMAMRIAGREDLVVGAGSLFVAAEMIEELLGVPGERYPLLTAVSARSPGALPGVLR